MRQFTEDSKISSLKHISACACKVSCIQLFADPRTVAHQAPLFIGFSRQEYWSGLPFLPSEIFLTQGSNPHLLCLLDWQADSLPLSHQGSHLKKNTNTVYYRIYMEFRKMVTITLCTRQQKRH